MFIVCEIGSNWFTLDHCKTSIHNAKSFGADAVKFQMFSSEELYGSDIRPLTNTLPRDWVPILSEKAKAFQIEFMCTAFSADGVRFLNPYVVRHKIASAELCHTDMLKAAGESGKPIILSTGGHSISDVQYALNVLKGYKDITLLYCESSYPAYHTDLRKLQLLRDFGYPVGLSDHSREIYSIPLLARREQCSVFEKHVNFVSATGPDAPHSLNGTEFREMVRAIRGTPDEPVLLSPYEQDMVRVHNRRLIATADIRPGENLSYEKNYGIFRGTSDDQEGYHPALAPRVHGKQAIIEIKKGQPIGPKGVTL